MPESKVNDSTEFCLASLERGELALLVVYFMRNIIRAQKMINFLKKPMRKIKIQIPSQVSKSRGYSSTFFQIIPSKPSVLVLQSVADPVKFLSCS